MYGQKKKQTNRHYGCEAVEALCFFLNLVPRAFSSAIFKMAARREKTLFPKGPVIKCFVIPSKSKIDFLTPTVAVTAVPAAVEIELS